MNPSNKKSPPPAWPPAWPPAINVRQPFARPAAHAQQIRPVVAQLKTAPPITRPLAPPVYRPQPTPKVLQCKSALVRPPLPVNQKWPGSRTIQRAATVVAVDEKKPDAAELLRQQRKAAKQAQKAARALVRAQEEKVAALNLAEKKTFYGMNALQAHTYVQGRSAAQLTDLKLNPRLFRTYECSTGGMGGEYMFSDIGHGLGAILAQTVIHVHWDALYNRDYGHFKNHTDKTKGGGSLGPIDAAKLTAMNVPAQETATRVQELKEAK